MKITFGFGRALYMQVRERAEFSFYSETIKQIQSADAARSRRNSPSRVRIVVNYKKGGLHCTGNGACTRTPRNNRACVYASVCDAHTRIRCIGIMPFKSRPGSVRRPLRSTRWEFEKIILNILVSRACGAYLVFIAWIKGNRYENTRRTKLHIYNVLPLLLYI